MYQELIAFWKRKKSCDFALPLIVGSTPSNGCQDFDTCLVEQGKHMNVPVFEHKGCLQTVAFSLSCCCRDTILGVWKLTRFDFQLLQHTLLVMCCARTCIFSRHKKAFILLRKLLFMPFFLDIFVGFCICIKI